MSRGWFQINASRFSPGDFPVLNASLQDRSGLFTAGDDPPSTGCVCSAAGKNRHEHQCLRYIAAASGGQRGSGLLV